MSLATLLSRKIGLEFEVLPEPSAERLAELLVAFANGSGGTVLLGVTPEGKLTGDLQMEDAEHALRGALALCSPPVETTWQQFDERGGLAVAISVQHSTVMHSLTDGRVLMRTRGGNEVLDGPRISRLAATRATGDFEQEIVPGAKRSDLNDDVIENFIQLRKRRVGMDLTMTEADLLQGVGALTADGHVTVAGVLLFGKRPQFFLPQSGLTYVRFAGTDRMNVTSPERYLNREEFDGPLAVVIEQAGAHLWRQLRGAAVVRGLVREDYYLLPQDAVREALVNALVHRDYRVPGRRVEVHQFEDRLEITSPGGLPAWITVENMVYEHYSRNPRLVNVLYEWKYIEQLGLGVDRMITEMALAGYPPPELNDWKHAFNVTLRRGSGIPSLPIPLDPEVSRNLNDRQIRALQYLIVNDRITSSTFRELVPNVVAETLRLDLVELVEKGLLVKIGDKKGTYYILKQKAQR